MPGVDHDVLSKKKAPTLQKGAPAQPAKAPVPEVGARLHQSSTADMQGNVGNSGLKDLLRDEKSKGPAKDPTRMSADELRAQAKADAQHLAKKAGPGQKKPAGKGDTAELDEKAKAHLDAEAARKKKEAESERVKAQDAAAHHAREKTAHKPAAKRPEPVAKAAAPKGKAAAAGTAALAAAHSDKKPGKAGDHAVHAKKEVHAQTAKHAAHTKVAAKEAEHEHAKGKAEIGRSLAGKKTGEVGSQVKAAKAKLVETGKRASEKKITAAHAQKKVEDVAHRQKVQGPAELTKAPAEKGAPTEKHAKKAGQKEPKGKAGAPGSAEAGPASTKAPDAHQAKQAAHEVKVEQAETGKKAAELKVDEHKVQKHAAEAKVEAEGDVAKKGAHAKEAEQHALAEKAAADKVKKHDEAVDGIQAAKEKDKTIEEVSRAADLAAHDGEEVTLVGLYVPRPAEGGGAHLGHVSVMIGDQEVRLGHEVRGTSELLRLAGEKVVVTGKLDLKKQAGQGLDPGRREKPVLTGFRSPHRR